NVLGGSATLPKTIARALGGSVRAGARVDRVEQDEHGVTVHHDAGGERRAVRARAAVVAVPAHRAGALVAGLPAGTAAALAAIAYGPYVVGAFLTDEAGPMPYDGIYAIATPKRSFNMLFNTASALRGVGPRQPGGSLMVYSGAALAARFDRMSDDDVARLYQQELVELFPQLRGRVAEARIVR